MLTEDMLPANGQTVEVYTTGRGGHQGQLTFTGKLMERVYRPTLTGTSSVVGIKVRKLVGTNTVQIVTIASDHIVAISTAQEDDRP